MPRASLMFSLNRGMPTSLRTWSGTSVPSRYSTGSTVKFRPLHSLKPATLVRSSSRRKLYPRNGSFRASVATPRLLSLRRHRAASPLADSDDHELGRLHRRHADDEDQPAVVDVVLCHRGPVALDEEGLLGGPAHERPVAPNRGEEHGDALPDTRPRQLVVGLEDDPLRAAVEGCLQEDEEPAHVDVLELGFAGGAAGSPDSYGPLLVSEVAQHVDVARVQDVLLLPQQLHLEVVDPADDLVGRRLVHSAEIVGAGVHADHVTARWHQQRRCRLRRRERVLDL